MRLTRLHGSQGNTDPDTDEEGFREALFYPA
jgi:hypothetical protein